MFDPLGKCSPFTMRMRFLLKCIWAAMGQAWDKKLSADHSTLFIDWCSELRQIRTMSINQLYSENGCLKPETSHFHRCVRIDNVHRGTAARLSEVKIDLCNREMSCGSRQTYDNTEVRTPSRSLRCSSQKADAQRT